jgi:hypothetical protein
MAINIYYYKVTGIQQVKQENLSESGILADETGFCSFKGWSYHF